MGSYNYPMGSEKVIKLGKYKVRLMWNTQLGMQGFRGMIISPKDALGVENIHIEF